MVLIIIGVAVLAGGCAVAGLVLWQAGERKVTGPEMGTVVALSLSAILLALLLAGVLFALSAIINIIARNALAENAPVQENVRPALDRLEQSLRMLNQSRPSSVSTQELGGNAAANFAPMLELWRDYVLMNDSQRERFAARHWSRRRDAWAEQIERDVLVGDWVSAFSRLDDLRLLMPDDKLVSELRERVESEQNARLEEEMRSARTRFRNFVAGANWQQAEELASDLQKKYPGKSEPRQLAEDVRREREGWERENMERLFRDISSANQRRQWRQAVLAVEEFIRRYPLDARAEALRLDLPTLQENAAAHERKEQEELFKDLLKKQRYPEALSVARAVIQKYPNSPSAAELNKLLPRVEELSRQAAAAQQQAAAAVAPAAAVPAGA
jgi:outer membrane protein assembly factor BamD (BamD/ComL family)